MELEALQSIYFQEFQGTTAPAFRCADCPGFPLTHGQLRRGVSWPPRPAEISSTPPISFQLNLTCDASVDVNREQRPPCTSSLRCVVARHSPFANVDRRARRSAAEAAVDDVRMRVKFPEAYPNEVPEVALESDELDDARLAPLKAKLDELVGGGALR